MLFCAVFLTQLLMAQTTDFESFIAGSVHYQGVGATTTSPGGYTIPDPYGSLWTVADEWGFTPSTPFDEEVMDDGTGNMVWRVSNAVTTTGFSNIPFSPVSVLPAGETLSDLWNNRGDNHTTPENPPLSRATAGTSHFRGSFKFKSATGLPQNGLSINISPAPKQSNIRQSFISISDNGTTGLDIGFFDTDASGGFNGTTIATDLSYNDWHEIDIYITFVDGLNPDDSGNDVVVILLNGTEIHTGTTWETYYESLPSTFPQAPYAVDALMFRLSGTAQLGNFGNGFFIDDVTVSNESYPLVFPVMVYESDGITFKSGHATIQAAIDAADPGDVIEVAAGTYEENINLSGTSNLTLKGPFADISACDLARDGTGEAVIQGTVTVSESNALAFFVLDGFTIESGTSTGINNVRLEGGGIYNNIIRGDWLSGNSPNNRGISTASSSPVVSQSWTLQGNNIAGYRFGISLDGNSQLSSANILENCVSDCQRGIQSQAAFHSGTPDIVIEANEFDGNEQGIRLAGGYTAVQKNLIQNCSVFGIRPGVDGAAMDNLSIVNNIVDDTPLALSFDQVPSSTVDLVITENAFLNVSGSTIFANFDFDAPCNWFGTDDASTILASISGSGNVDVQSFLTSGSDSGNNAPGFDPTGDCDGCTGGIVTNLNTSETYCSI